MKILMIAPQPFFEPRGTPISVRQRVTGLSKLGHQIDLATYHLGEDVELPGLRICRTPFIAAIRTLKVGPSWQKIPLDFLLFMESILLLFRSKYDVIHTHEEAGFFSVFLSWIFNLPHIYDMHSSLPKQLVNFRFGDNKLMIGVFEYLERLVINTCDAVITIGEDLEQHVRVINPDVPMQMIENLPLNIEQTMDDIPAEIEARFNNNLGLSIVYTGTFERYQGVDLLIRGFAKTITQFPGTKLILVGGKPDQIQQYQKLASELGLTNSVDFSGIVSLEDANYYMQLADVLVSPRIEGTSVPLKIYTYLYAGKPILATNIPSHTLVLTQENACLVEPSVEGFAVGLITLIADKTLRTDLGAQARKLAVEKYGLAQYLSKLEKLYSNVGADSEANSTMDNVSGLG
jgi:glycosyltransferase involved in cell wall biosynthesis